jgi:glycosyltransferase involved in cell wall biosynthesis
MGPHRLDTRWKPLHVSPEKLHRQPGLVLHVITNLGAGGAELMLFRLVTAGSANGRYRHVVVSLMSKWTVGPMLEAAGIEVIELGMRNMFRAPATLYRLTRLIRARRPAIVQTWMAHADLIGGLAARAAGVKNILWGVRNAERGRKKGTSRNNWLIRRASALLSKRVPARIVYVAHSARVVHEELGYAPEKALVIPNGYSVPTDPDPHPLRNELGVAEDALLIGSAGRYNPQKDHRTFVQAAGRVAAQEPQARFILMGIDILWENKELAGWIEATGYKERFHLLGERRDIARLLPGLDLFCLHSITEGFPNVVAEAMSVGVECVVTNVGDAAFLVAETGSVVPPSQPQALSQAIVAAIRANPEARRTRGAAARQRIIAHFSMTAILRRYEELYAGLATGEDLNGAGGGCPPREKAEISLP